MILFRSIPIILLLELESILATSCPRHCICKNDGLNVTCTGKSLKSVPLGIPVNVEELDLSKNLFNNLSSKAFYSLTKLRILRLNHCEIKIIANDSFKGLENVRNIYLMNNDLEYLYQDMFKNLKSLLHLYLSYNEFQSIPALTSFSMTRLHLDNNHIASAHIHDSFKVNTALRTIVLTSNKIESLTATDFHNLRNTGIQSLMLKMNNLEIIDPRAFEPVKDSLQNLELEGNQLLSSMQLEISLRAFAGGSRLIFIDLRFTGLTNISRSFFQPFVDSHLHRIDIGNNAQLSLIDDDAFQELERVQVLIADKCRIWSPNIRFSALTALRQVNLSSNNFLQCPHRLPGSVEIVDLSKNDIRHILRDDFKSLSSLKQLILSNNAISSIELNSFSDLVKLTFLDLSHNRLDILQARLFFSLSYLAILKLNHQSPCLKHISVHSLLLPKLLSLNLDHNCLDISTVSAPIFQACPRLSHLSLVGNTIDYLGDKLFLGLTNISFLDLSHNQIRGWSPHTFVALKSTLIDLNLSFNNLVFLSTIATEDNFLPSTWTLLQRISLANNHWNCSCSAVKWLLAHKNLMRNVNNIICEYSDKKMRGKLFDMEEVRDCPTEETVTRKMNMLQVLANNRARIHPTIYLIIPLVILILAIMIYFRKRLLEIGRHIIQGANNNRYHHLADRKTTETTVFHNNIIMDEDIPNMGDSCLVFGDSDLFDASDLVVSVEWFDAVRMSPYDRIEDILFLSPQMGIDCGQLTVTIIHNLQSFENKVAAYHSRILVIDYPALDRAILRTIVMERWTERYDEDHMKSTYLFASTEVDEQDEIVQLFEEYGIIEYSSSDIIDKFYTLFD